MTEKSKADKFKDNLAYLIVILTGISFGLALLLLGLFVLYILATEAPGILIGALIIGSVVCAIVWAVDRVQSCRDEKLYEEFLSDK